MRTFVVITSRVDCRRHVVSKTIVTSRYLQGLMWCLQGLVAWLPARGYTSLGSMPTYREDASPQAG